MSMDAPIRSLQHVGPAVSSKKCVIGGVANHSTSMITKTSVPIFHGSDQTPMQPEEELAAARPMQYPSYRFASEADAKPDIAQSTKASENLRSTAVPVFHFHDI